MIRSKWKIAVSGLALLCLVAGFGFAAGAEEPDPTPTIEMWHWETPPHRVEGIENLVDRFEEETGITVEQVPIDFGDYVSRILSAIATGDLPEIIQINPPQLPLLLEHNALVEVDDLFERLNARHGYSPAHYELYIMDGAQWGIPAFGVYWPMTYRADLYREAGLDPPKTWDELLHAAEVLTTDDHYGYMLPVSDHGNYGSQVVWSFLRSNNAQIVDVVDGEERIVFDSPETRETYAFLAELAEYTVPGAEEMDWGMAERLLREGIPATAMYTGSWILPVYQDTPELLENYAMDLMPIPEGGRVAHTGYPRAMVLTQAAAEHREAVDQFLEWFYEPENSAEFMLSEPGLFAPVTETTATSEHFLGDEVISRVRDAMEKQIEAGDTLEVIGFIGDEPSRFSAEIESSFLLGRVLQRIVLDGWSVDEAVEWGQEQYEAIIRD